MSSFGMSLTYARKVSSVSNLSPRRHPLRWRVQKNVLAPGFWFVVAEQKDYETDRGNECTPAKRL